MVVSGAVGGLLGSVKHVLAEASRTNDGFPADTGIQDGSAKLASKSLKGDTRETYHVAKGQASQALDITGDHAGQYIDVGKGTGRHAM